MAFFRGGRRSRNGLLAPTNPLERNLKFQLPWQAAAIDEYLADIYLVFYTSNGKPFVVRPWLTAIIDLATSKILAITISFINPSKRSLAKVMRECLRIHGRLPQEILFDRGSNFKSKYAAELLASLGIINTLRPAAYSRSGGEIEAVFGEFIKMWLSQRHCWLTLMEAPDKQSTFQRNLSALLPLKLMRTVITG
jgi:transposase InsO family protein